MSAEIEEAKRLYSLRNASLAEENQKKSPLNSVKAQYYNEKAGNEKLNALNAIPNKDPKVIKSNSCEEDSALMVERKSSDEHEVNPLQLDEDLPSESPSSAGVPVILIETKYESPPAHDITEDDATIEETKPLESSPIRRRSSDVSQLSPVNADGRLSLSMPQLVQTKEPTSFELPKTLGNNTLAFVNPDMKSALSSTKFMEMFLEMEREPEVGTSTEMDLGKGILCDVETMGFAGLWSHPILRIYFLLYLATRNLDTLYFFRIDIEKFDNPGSIEVSNQAYRQAYAMEIFTKYLSSRSSKPLVECLPLGSSSSDYELYTELLKRVISNLNNCKVALFSDIDIVAAKTMNVLFGGKSISLCDNEGSLDTFVQSAQYQCMVSDFKNSDFFTVNHIKRIIQRVFDIPGDTLERIRDSLTKHLDDSCFEWREAVNDKALLLSKASSKVISLSANNISAKGNVKRANSLKIFQLGKSKSQKKLESPKSSQLNTKFLSENLIENHIDHIFVKYSDKNSETVCQFCFSHEDHGQLYECEYCHYICHKQCKQKVSVKCAQLGQQNLNRKSRINSSKEESLEKLIEKLQYLNKEIEIAESVKSGASKLHQASAQTSPKNSKKPPSRSSTNQSHEYEAEVKEMNRKLKLLENKKSNVLLEIAQKLASNDVAEKYKSNETISSFIQSKLSDMNEKYLIRVSMSLESRKKAGESKKGLIIGPNSTSNDVIDMILERRAEKNTAIDPRGLYLSCENASGISEPLDISDRPAIFTHLLGDVNFVLCRQRVFMASTLNRRTRLSTALLSTAPKSTINFNAQKRLAVINEFVETEKNYVEGLKLVVEVFLNPLREKPKVLNRYIAEGMFSNVPDLLREHEIILAEMNNRLAIIEKSDLDNPKGFADLFASHLDKVSAMYCMYCGNMHNSRRTMSKMLSKNSAFAKFMRQKESDPRLKKRSINDYLMQPLHRITRYPILLKRLFSCTPSDHPDYTNLIMVLGHMEEINSLVNDIVKKKENDFRLRYIQQNIVWNDVCQGFSITGERRRLVFEKIFQMQFGQEWQDVLLVVLNDMLMIIRVEKKKNIEMFQLIGKPIHFEYLIPMTAEHLSEINKNYGKTESYLQLFVYGQKTLTFKATSNAETNTWLKDIEVICGKFRYHKAWSLLNKPLSFIPETILQSPEKPGSPDRNDEKGNEIEALTSMLRSSMIASPLLDIRQDGSVISQHSLSSVLPFDGLSTEIDMEDEIIGE